MKILITGGAGFIGSNLVDHFLEQGLQVVCLDNLSTGQKKNIEHHLSNPNFKFIIGDIRDLEICKLAIAKCDYVSHQAALGSVPRSIADPINTNSVNIDGFLNVLVAARDAKVKRFVYASSSSVYGNSQELPKYEENIGKQLSPYAITKYVNELYSDVFSKSYNMQCIGLRYFNVFGKRQNPDGDYAAVIPLWIKQLISHEHPIINGAGSISRDFTYIDNVIQANEKSLFLTKKQIRKGQQEYYNTKLKANNLRFPNSKIQSNPTEDLYKIKPLNDCSFSEVFNIACGDNTTLLELYDYLKKNLSKYDDEISKIDPFFGPKRAGDIQYSQASILKAHTILEYEPKYKLKTGLEHLTKWYFNYLK